MHVMQDTLAQYCYANVHVSPSVYMYLSRNAEVLGSLVTSKVITRLLSLEPMIGTYSPTVQGVHPRGIGVGWLF